MNNKNWLLAAVTIMMLTACSIEDNNAANNPNEPQQLFDYTIIWYGHGGGDLDLNLALNMMDFYNAAETSYRNVSMVAQYKFSSSETLESTYKDTKNNIEKKFKPGTPEYEQAIATVEKLKTLYSCGDKTMRFVVNDQKAIYTNADKGGEIDVDKSTFIGPDNADISSVDSLVNFINWAASVKPAKKYILVLSDHGGGYNIMDDADAPGATSATRGVIYDNGHNSKHFTVKTLAQAISAAKVRPACVYQDACLMNNVEYLFELAPTTDYIVSSSFIVPGEGGDYPALINALSQNPDDIEAALTIFTKASVDRWDKVADNSGNLGEPVYHDMTVMRTDRLDAFGQELKSFTDRLIDAYQSGDATVKAAIDNCTAHAYRVNKNKPYYDIIDYLVNLSAALPDVFGQPLNHPLGKAFDSAIVYQQSSKWLQENDHTVDCSVMMGWRGCVLVISELMEGFPFIIYLYADGSADYYTAINMAEPHFLASTPWGSTLDATYGQLRFDQLTGWSRWLRLNEQEPNPECYNGFNPLLPTLVDDDLIQH